MGSSDELSSAPPPDPKVPNSTWPEVLPGVHIRDLDDAATELGIDLDELDESD